MKKGPRRFTQTHLDAAYSRGFEDGKTRSTTLARLDLQKVRDEHQRALKAQAIQIVGHLAEAIEHVMSTGH